MDVEPGRRSLDGGLLTIEPISHTPAHSRARRTPDLLQRDER